MKATCNWCNRTAARGSIQGHMACEKHISKLPTPNEKIWHFELVLFDAATEKRVEGYDLHTWGNTRDQAMIFPPMDAIRMIVDLSDDMVEYMEKETEKENES